MTFSLLSSHSLEFAHVRSRNWGAENRKVVNLRSLCSTLVVLDEKLHVLHVLEFDKAKIHRHPFQVFLSHSIKLKNCIRPELPSLQRNLLNFLHGRVALRSVKIQGPRLVDENFDVLGPFVLRSFDFDGVNFDSLVEGNVDDQLRKFRVNLKASAIFDEFRTCSSQSDSRKPPALVRQ